MAEPATPDGSDAFAGDAVGDDEVLPAGELGAWLIGMQAALAGEREAEVPCGSCTACCTSSQFVHVEPDETEALARIPAELRFPAPGLPRGHVVLGYDEHGRCPMLVDGACSIYAHRPRTCRTYDCRVFPAAGVDLDEPAKAAIAARARRWRFAHADAAAEQRHASVRAAATFLAEHPEVLPDGAAPLPPTPRAVLAVELHDLFVGADPALADGATLTLVEPTTDEVTVALRRRTGRRPA